MSRTVNAWAIVNDETGRLMLIDVSIGGMTPARMEACAIYATKAAAKHNKRDDERIVRVQINEID